MKKLKLLSLSGLVVVIGLYSCSKGSTGATGPAGPAGPDSVYHSTWIPLDFQGAVQDGDSVYYQDVNCANLSQGILDSGMIISYVGQQDATGYFDVEPTSNYGIIEDYQAGSIQYVTFPISEGGISATLNGARGIRFVLIPSAVLAQTDSFKGMSKAQISTMSYDKITAILDSAATKPQNN